MDKREILKELEEIGLSEREARVYVASLELGPTTAQKISAKAQIARPTTYLIIESLRERGLMSTFREGKKNYFLAGKPSQLEYLIATQREELERRSTAMSRIVGYVEKMNKGDDEKIDLFINEGPQSILEIQNFVLEGEPDEEIIELTDQARVRKYLPPPTKCRKRTKIRTTKKHRCLIANMENENEGIDWNSRAVTKGSNMGADLYVHGDDVAFLILGQKIQTIRIRNADVAKTLKMLFSHAWDAAKKGKKGR